MVAEVVDALLSGAPIDDRLSEMLAANSHLGGGASAPSHEQPARDSDDDSDPDGLFRDEEAPGLFGDSNDLLKEPVDPQKERQAMIEAAWDQWDRDAEDEDE